MLLSGESLPSQFSCCFFSFSISSHAMQAKVKPSLLTISIYKDILSNIEGKKQRPYKRLLKMVITSKDKGTPQAFHFPQLFRNVLPLEPSLHSFLLKAAAFCNARRWLSSKTYHWMGSQLHALSSPGKCYWSYMCSIPWDPHFTLRMG